MFEPLSNLTSNLTYRIRKFSSGFFECSLFWGAWARDALYLHTLALAALDLNGKCGYFCSDPVTIAHPLCKPSVRDVYGVYNLTAFTTNIPLESWLTMTVARTL